MNGIFMWVGGGVALVLLFLGLYMVVHPNKPQVIQSLWEDLIQRVTIAGLVVVVAFLGWHYAHCRMTHGEPDAASHREAVAVPVATVQPGGDVVGIAEIAPGAPQAPAADGSRIWRMILWINLCLALPWVTAFGTRYVLELGSNAASFTLLAAYTVADMAMGMTIASLTFARGSGMMALVGILALALGYNYWACELVAKLWSGARRRR